MLESDMWHFFISRLNYCRSIMMVVNVKLLKIPNQTSWSNKPGLSNPTRKIHGGWENWEEYSSMKMQNYAHIWDSQCPTSRFHNTSMELARLREKTQKSGAKTLLRYIEDTFFR